MYATFLLLAYFAAIESRFCGALVSGCVFVRRGVYLLVSALRCGAKSQGAWCRCSRHSGCHRHAGAQFFFTPSYSRHHAIWLGGKTVLDRRQLSAEAQLMGALVSKSWPSRRSLFHSSIERDFGRMPLKKHREDKRRWVRGGIDKNGCLRWLGDLAPRWWPGRRVPGDVLLCRILSGRSCAADRYVRWRSEASAACRRFARRHSRRYAEATTAGCCRPR